MALAAAGVLLLATTPAACQLGGRRVWIRWRLRTDRFVPRFDDPFVGTMNAEYYGPDGQPFRRVEGVTTAGTRIPVEVN